MWKCVYKWHTVHQVKGILVILDYSSILAAGRRLPKKMSNELIGIAEDEQRLWQGEKIAVWAPKKKMSKPIQVLSWEMKGYLTNSKVACSPELKMTKAGLLSTSSIWSELGSEKSFLREHTRHGGMEHSVEITLKTGGEIKSVLKMHSARLAKRQVGEEKWVTFKRHGACRGALRYTYTNTHIQGGSAVEQVLSEPRSKNT